MKISDVKGLKKVCAVLQDKEQRRALDGLAEKLLERGILWEALQTDNSRTAVVFEEEGMVQETTVGEAANALELIVWGEQQGNTVGVLYITDSKQILDRLNSVGLPVLVCYHAGNKGEDFSQARYVVEQVEEVEPEYLERVYRRYAGMPWDILETERLLLRESIPEDAEAFRRIYQEDSITRYMEGLAESKVGNPNYFRVYAENVYAFYEFGIWTVLLKETGEVIGRVGLSMRETFENPQLGYVIGVPWQRKGLAKEACEGVLKYAKEELGIERIEVLIQEENKASLNLACQLGFVYERNLHIEEKAYQLLVKNYTY